MLVRCEFGKLQSERKKCITQICDLLGGNSAGRDAAVRVLANRMDVEVRSLPCLLALMQCFEASEDARKLCMKCVEPAELRAIQGQLNFSFVNFQVPAKIPRVPSESWWL